MAALVIDDNTKRQIEDIIVYAKANPLNPEILIAQAKKDLLMYKEFLNSYTIYIPVGFRVTYTQELQPPGLCDHISISVDHPGKLPSQVAVEMLMMIFKMITDQPYEDRIVSVWIEDFNQQLSAVNIVMKCEV